jgi:hypothetical protein
MMERGADIAVYSPDDRLLLVVEVKNRQEASAAWAAKLRRNLLIHHALPAAQYFLLALPDRLYLWKNASTPSEAPPDFVASTGDVLREYLGGWVDRPERIAEESLQIALTSWLQDIAGSARNPSEESEADRMLIESGLYEPIRNGAVATELVR